MSRISPEQSLLSIWAMAAGLGTLGAGMGYLYP